MWKHGFFESYTRVPFAGHFEDMASLREQSMQSAPENKEGDLPKALYLHQRSV